MSKSNQFWSHCLHSLLYSHNRWDLCGFQNILDRFLPISRISARKASFTKMFYAIPFFCRFDTKKMIESEHFLLGETYLQKWPWYYTTKNCRYRPEKWRTVSHGPSEISCGWQTNDIISISMKFLPVYSFVQFSFFPPSRRLHRYLFCFSFPFPLTIYKHKHRKCARMCVCVEKRRRNVWR